jgi:hypothetical protein
MGLTDRLRERRAAARDRRELGRAFDGAATPAMRAELLTMVQHQAPLWR